MSYLLKDWNERISDKVLIFSSVVVNYMKHSFNDNTVKALEAKISEHPYIINIFTLLDDLFSKQIRTGKQNVTGEYTN